MINQNFRYLVLGKDGLLGRELIGAFHDRDVIGVGRDADFDFSKKEDLIAVILRFQPDVVINAIGYTEVHKAEEDFSACYQINGYSVGLLANVCRDLGVLLAHFSTDYVFPGLKKDGYNEESARKPLNQYGQSKMLGEDLLLEEMEMDLPGSDAEPGKYYLIRTASLFSVGKKCLPQRFLELAAGNQPIKAVNDQYISPTFAKDLAKQVKWLIESREFDYGIYHIVNDGVATPFQIAETILSKYNRQNLIEAVALEDLNSKVVRPKYAVLENTKLPNMRHWKEAMAEFLEELNWEM